MASSLETNKILAAILTAGIFASGAGVVSRMIYHPTVPDEPSYVIEVAAEAGLGGGDEGGDESISVAVLLATADIAGGEKAAKKCVSCHTFEEGGANKIGPNLYGVLGRDIASFGGFGYSEALSSLDGNWTYEALDAFMAKPKDFAPGTKMSYAGMRNAEDRADLIMYLRSLAADPMPLPEAGTDTAEETSGGASEGQEAAAATEDATEEAKTAAAVALDQVEDVAEKAEDAVGEMAKAAADVVEGASETAASAAETVTNAASETVEAAGAAVADAGEAAKNAVAQAADSTAETLSSAVATVGAAASSAAGAAKETVDGAASGLVAMIAEGDVGKGEKVSKKCKACHVFEEGGKNKLGPGLWDVIDRKIASYDGFNYSGALSALDGEWTYDKLDQFLAAPKNYVPGTKMVFAGVKKEKDRANLLAYLRTLAAEPAPLN